MSPRARLGWYVRRLRSMGAGEAVSHGRRAAMHLVDDAEWRFVRGLWRRRWIPGDEKLYERTSRSDASIGPLRHDRIAALEARCPDACEAIVGAAEQWLAGTVDVLGYENVDIAAAGPELDRDPITGNRWPLRHGRAIDYRHATVGDPKLVWELNRCQELPLLVLAGLLSGDGRFISEAVSRLLRWVAAHPPGRGIAWANAFEPALRAVSIAVALDGLRGRSELGPAECRKVERALWQHGRWISRDLSSHSSANNHLIGELVGLLAVASLLPDLRHATRWSRLARDGLIRESKLQVLRDGHGSEQSFAYSLFSADLLLLGAALTEMTGGACPPSLRSALERAADALSLVVDAHEPDPAFGDDDDGRAIVLDSAGKRNARSVAASLAAFLGHGGARRLAVTPDPVSVLLFGEEGLARFDGAVEAPPPGDGILRDGGLVVMRRDGARLLFDVGPLGYLSTAAHGHADALQVDLAAGRSELVTDPGTGSYFGDPGLRAALRGTRAHATVAVDNVDQSEQGGPFLWAKHAAAQLLVASLDEGYAVGEHDGYTRLEPPVTHRRAVVGLSAGAFVVVDRLRSEQEHLYEQAWPLAPGLEPEVDGELATVLRSGRPVLLVAGAASTSTSLVASSGRWSRRLETSEAVWVLRRSLRAREVELATLLVPLAAAGEAPAPAVRLQLTRRGNDDATTVVSGSVDETGFEVRLELDVDVPRVSVR